MEDIQNFNENYTSDNKTLNRRFSNTLRFTKQFISKDDKILDLGVTNMLADLFREDGYDITNTKEGLDLDFDFDVVSDEQYDVVTGFEILEHMVSPFPLLRAIKAKKLIVSIPLRLWFATAYWSNSSPYDRHYHEFEPRQFDMLLEKAGWKIVKSEKWTSYDNTLGIRPILRRFTPRYYITYCERI